MGARRAGRRRRHALPPAGARGRRSRARAAAERREPAGRAVRARAVGGVALRPQPRDIPIRVTRLLAPIHFLEERGTPPPGDRPQRPVYIPDLGVSRWVAGYIRGL